MGVASRSGQEASDGRSVQGRSEEGVSDARALKLGRSEEGRSALTPPPGREVKAAAATPVAAAAAAAAAALALWSEIMLAGTRQARRLPGGALAGTVSFTVRPPGRAKVTRSPAAALAGTVRRSSSRTPRSNANGGAKAAALALLLP